MPFEGSYYSVHFYSVPILSSSCVRLGNQIIDTTTYDLGNVRSHYLHCSTKSILLDPMHAVTWPLSGVLVGLPLYLVAYLCGSQAWWPWLLAAFAGGYGLSVLFRIGARKNGLVRAQRGWDYSVRFQIVLAQDWHDFQAKLR